MSGASLKWYLKHLQEGRTPEEAERLAKNRVRGNSASPTSKVRKGANTASSKGSSGIRASGRVNADPTAKTGSVRIATPAAKRKSSQITPQKPPNSKRQRGSYAQVARGQLSAPNPSRAAEGQRRYADALKGIRMAVLPLNYPAEILKAAELTALQNLLMEEVYRGCKDPVRFHGVHFKGGFMQLDCRNEDSVNWLREIAPKLTGWKGPTLCVRRGEDIPIMHSMTVLLPRCEGKHFEFALGLLRNQNRGINTSAWRVVDSKMEGAGWRLNLCVNDESYKVIRKEGFRLSYRYSEVVIRPYKPKTTEKEDEKMQVDEESTRPSTMTVEQVSTAKTTAEVPAVKPTTEEGELPSTQELLEGLEDLIGTAGDGADEDQFLIEPIL
ncbi:uncharacterized protein LOC120781517 [Bactrocera tryoni]|uniref:uncharacterized protein LOC120781517 n=1 Tax=Bactrocera tryoni TaxID=59916 RepID=UPI001A97B4EB|nr:uncharacterized protein LOC120781517 [Bactrocera tryoni]